jgi:zinc transport system ATP-binding protein
LILEIIRLKDVFVSYNEETVLDGVDLKVNDKEFLSIIGPNGGGKTTLAKTMLGLVKPWKGEVFVAEGLKIGYVPQHTKFDRGFPINVYDVIISGRIQSSIRFFRGFSREDKSHAAEVIRALKLESIQKKQIGSLSGGQLQKVLIGRALVGKPDVLILDEPTANLDSENKREIYEALHNFNKNKAVILITHDLEYLNENKRDVVLLNKKIMYRGESVNRMDAGHVHS